MIQQGVSMRPTPSVPNRAHSTEANRFEAYLRSKKLKLTGERMVILNTIFHKNSHFDAEELHADLKGLEQKISRATVYRTLDLLVQCGLVRKSSLGSTHANYEAAHENEHHDHLICLNCKKVFEFYRPDLETLQEVICKEHQFKPLHHSLQIFGLCEDCAGKADENLISTLVAQIHT
jgi:Fur family ferric uptake transcriptional regulator